MSYIMIFGLVLGCITLLVDRKALRFDKDVTSKFISLMIGITLIRWAIMSLSVQTSNIQATGMNQIPLWWFLLVWWEDLAFALPIYWMKDKFKLSKYIWMPATAALSIYFALGHLYQGNVGWIALLVPYYIGYRFGKKHGFATTMVCHVLYDLFTFLSVKLSPFVLF